MRKESSRVAVAVVGACCLLITSCLPSRLSAQGAAPKPEYFGFYALDGGKLIAIGDSKSDTPPTLQQVNVAVLGASQPTSRFAVQLGTGSNFLLFDVSPADAGRAISIYRLPFVRSEVTIPDTPFGSVTVRQRNLPGVMRLAQSQIRLLQKPVPSQPQMIELVPDPPLAQGLYGVLFAPATGGAGAGQSAAWTTLLLIGQSPEAERSGQCIDLTLTGGLGGMLGIDSPDVGRIAIFPLLNPGRAPACSSTPGSSMGPAGTPPPPSGANPETANPGTLASLSAAIERGEEVVFKIKYNTGMNQRDGLVTLSKTAVAFQPTVGATGFSVSPDKILELIDQPQEANRVRLKVAIKNKRGDKEGTKGFDFYNPATFVNGFRISCAQCDNSMSVLYALLQKVRGRD